MCCTIYGSEAMPGAATSVKYCFLSVSALSVLHALKQQGNLRSYNTTQQTAYVSADNPSNWTQADRVVNQIQLFSSKPWIISG